MTRVALGYSYFSRYLLRTVWSPKPPRSGEASGFKVHYSDGSIADGHKNSVPHQASGTPA